MPHFSTLELTLAALATEAAVGYPNFVYRAIGHPVTWMGALLNLLERELNRSDASANRQRLLGAASLLALLAACAAAALLIIQSERVGLVGDGLVILVASSLLAQRSLYQHVRDVADALESCGLVAGRAAVSRIVGRNPDYLDESGVARAAIESLAENFSDGVVAPTFWLAIAGLVGATLYKGANTADSMIGHRTKRLRFFGWAAARLDDALNLPASRLSAILIGAVAIFVGGSPVGAVRAALRDAKLHRSPNAGWPEAAMAGALGLKLAGPRVYGETLLPDAFMGDGRREANVADVRRALRLMRAGCALQWLLVLALCVIWRW
jgi:adenosylcobinamide-phosphate synthase